MLTTKTQNGPTNRRISIQKKKTQNVMPTLIIYLCELTLHSSLIFPTFNIRTEIIKEYAPLRDICILNGLSII